jgi:hypothetical protein
MPIGVLRYIGEQDGLPGLTLLSHAFQLPHADHDADCEHRYILRHELFEREPDPTDGRPRTLV